MASQLSVLSRLSQDALAADELHGRSRRLLVNAVRAGAAAGLSQRQIAEAISRSQPEVSRLLRFHSQTPLGRALQRNRAAILQATASAGARNVRVFGSVSRGEDTPGSDIDLLVDLPDGVTLFDLSRLEIELERIVGAKVDVVPVGGLRHNLAERVHAEAIPL